jgi:isoaspartyl peptidase/L-asparaginase-like protein (Ntn-hydrolase superfamily)
MADPALRRPPVGFVAVHVGAGRHSTVKEPLYLAAMRAACSVAVAEGSGSALLAVASAIRALEVCPGCTRG